MTVTAGIRTLNNQCIHQRYARNANAAAIKVLDPICYASVPVLSHGSAGTPTRTWALGKGEGRFDAKVRELTVIAVFSLFSLGLAWAYEANFFAMFFAAAAAIAGVEAVRRSL